MRMPSKPTRQQATILLIVALIGCGSPTAPDSEILRAQAIPPALSLQNLVQAPVYTFIADRDILALLNWAPCTNPEQCSGLGPGERRSIPFTEILGYVPHTTAVVVYHWRLLPKGGGGFEVDSVRALVVELP